MIINKKTVSQTSKQDLLKKKKSSNSSSSSTVPVLMGQNSLDSKTEPKDNLTPNSDKKDTKDFYKGIKKTSSLSDSTFTTKKYKDSLDQQELPQQSLTTSTLNKKNLKTSVKANKNFKNSTDKDLKITTSSNKLESRNNSETNFLDNPLETNLGLQDFSNQEIQELLNQVENSNIQPENELDPLAKLPSEDLELIRISLEKADKINFISTFILLPISLILILLVVSNVFLWVSLATSRQVETNTSELETKIQQLENRLKPILNQLPNGSGELNQTIPFPDPETEAWLGSPDSKFIWVVYADPNCSACADLHPKMLDLQQEFRSNLSLVYRFYPNSDHGLRYANALACVHQEAGNDVFWQVLTEIYKTEILAREAWSVNTEINQENFLNCYNSNRFQSKIEEEVRLTDEAFTGGLLGTPTSVFYSVQKQKGRVVAGSLEPSQFKDKIQDLVGNTS